MIIDNVSDMTCKCIAYTKNVYLFDASIKIKELGEVPSKKRNDANQYVLWCCI